MQWPLNIIPILKPNKNTNLDTAYRLISLPHTLAKTQEKTIILLYITNNIPHITTQHERKHSTDTYTT